MGIIIGALTIIVALLVLLVFKLKSDKGLYHKNGNSARLTDGAKKDRQTSSFDSDNDSASSETLKMVLDSLPTAVWIANRKSMRLSYANNACLQLIGLESVEAMGTRTVADFVSFEQTNGLSGPEKLHFLSQQSQPNTIEIDCLTDDKKIINTRVNICYIDYMGNESVLAIITDLAKENELVSMLARVAQKEHEINKLNNHFLSSLSNEIRSPMDVIIGLTEIEINKSLQPEAIDKYKKINTAAKNLLSIITDILDLTKIEEDKLELNEEEFELEEVLNSALLVASPRLEGKNVELVYNGALELPRYLIGDKGRFYQILKNFLDNSAKYTEKGKIVFTVFVDSAHSDENNVTLNFVIDDSGIGMDETHLKRAFQSYSQLLKSTPNQYATTGLGMIISQQLCSLMGGSMRVESAPGLGTIVRVSIPFKRAENRETDFHPDKGYALSGKKILVADDERVSRDVINRILRSYNAECVTVSSGVEAMNEVLEHRERGEHFDAILLDYMMQGLTGVETAKQITMSLSITPKLLMVTPYQNYFTASELEKNGISGIIEKPFSPSQFVARISQSLGVKPTILDSSVTYSKYKYSKALVCDDYSLNLEVVSGMLSQFGIDTAVAANGAEGLSILKNNPNSFDLVFVDLHMPIMDGFEMAKEIRSNARFDGIPIICLTADTLKDTAEECFLAGMDDLIAKPLEFAKLHALLKKWMPKEKCQTEGSSVIEKNNALERFGGNQAQLDKALIQFADMLPTDWQSFSDAIGDSNHKNFILNLKGAAGTLDFFDVFKYANEFDNAIKRGKPDMNVYAKLIEACVEAKKEIYAKKVTAEDTVKMSGTNDEFFKLLKEIETELEEFSPKVASLIDTLKQKFATHAASPKIQEMCVLAEKYNFDAALAILKEIEL